MIITRLIGGLGNQMFQYAFGRHMAIVHNTTLKLDISYYQNQGEHTTPRQYELDCFNIIKSFATQEKIAEIKKHQPIWLQKVYRQLYPKACTLYKERTQNFDKNAFSTSSNAYFQGYWQSEKYFKDIESTIRKDFTFMLPPSNNAKPVIKKIQETNSISIHFRRTDYLGKEVSKICTPMYYHLALEKISGLIPDVHVFLFSDDIDWVKENVSFEYPTTYIDEKYTAQAGWQDMQLMSICKHNIIANSSFSWWAAWLNVNHEKIIIAPAEWNFKRKSASIIPKNWITIKT